MTVPLALQLLVPRGERALHFLMPFASAQAVASARHAGTKRRRVVNVRSHRAADVSRF